VASIDEEKKNAVRKLNQEKDDFKKENESLKKKVQELEQLTHTGYSSARLPVCFLIY
jgi:prefoldin subunit 5